MNVLNIIRYVKNSGKSNSAKHIDIGYHSIKIDDIYQDQLKQKLVLQVHMMMHAHATLEDLMLQIT